MPSLVNWIMLINISNVKTSGNFHRTKLHKVGDNAKCAACIQIRLLIDDRSITNFIQVLTRRNQIKILTYSFCHSCKISSWLRYT